MNHQHQSLPQDDGADASAGSVILRLLLPIFVPALLVQTGVGMLIPVLPLYLNDEEMSVSVIAVLVAAAGLGSMVSQLPTGWLLTRTAERNVMLVALTLLASSTASLGLTTAVVVIFLLRFVWGVGSTGWLLSRQTLMTRAAPSHVRGRAMSLFGGTARMGIFLGALAGGWTAQRFGFRTAFAAIATVTIIGAIPLLVDRNPVTSTRATGPRSKAGMFEAFRTHRRLLLLAGSGQVAIIMVRNGRQLVLPLIGVGLGLNARDVGFLVSIGAFADLVLFPIAGYLMDTFGRLYAIVPAFCGLGAGLLLLAVADSYQTVAIAATVIGLSNSIGSGTMLTLASDLAPEENPSQFLASLGTLREGGKIAGPLLVGVLAEYLGLSASAAALGILAFAATALIVFGIGETRDGIKPSMLNLPGS